MYHIITYQNQVNIERQSFKVHGFRVQLTEKQQFPLDQALLMFAQLGQLVWSTLAWTTSSWGTSGTRSTFSVRKAKPIARPTRRAAPAAAAMDPKLEEEAPFWSGLGAKIFYFLWTIRWLWKWRWKLQSAVPTWHTTVWMDVSKYYPNTVSLQTRDKEAIAAKTNTATKCHLTFDICMKCYEMLLCHTGRNRSCSGSNSRAFGTSPNQISGCGNSWRWNAKTQASRSMRGIWPASFPIWLLRPWRLRSKIYYTCFWYPWTETPFLQKYTLPGVLSVSVAGLWDDMPKLCVVWLAKGCKRMQKVQKKRHQDTNNAPRGRSQLVCPRRRYFPSKHQRSPKQCHSDRSQAWSPAVARPRRLGLGLCCNPSRWYKLQHPKSQKQIRLKPKSESLLVEQISLQWGYQSTDNTVTMVRKLHWYRRLTKP